MAINRDMKKVMLQSKAKKQSPSGASVEEWDDMRFIDVAIYKNSDMISVDTAKYKNSSHTGLTHFKDIKSGINRLVDGDIIYQIADCNTTPRLSNLSLKAVSDDA